MPKKDQLKILPQDLEAEKSILGALMLDKNAIIRVADFLKEEDFYVPAHQKIYSAILDLYQRNQPVDIITATSVLKDRMQLQEIGGSAYLTDVINSVPSSAHIVHYAEIVRHKKVLRDLLVTSSQISEEVFTNQEDPETLLDIIEQKIFALNQKSKTYSFSIIKDHLTEAFERIEKNYQNKDYGPTGVTSGFQQLDNLLSGYQKSDLIILGARPSMGKTAVTLDMARAAARDGKSVAYFSLEMSKEQIIDRIISAEAQVPLWKIRTGRLDESDFPMIQAGLNRLQEMPIFIDDTPSPTVLQIRSMARRLQMEHSLDLIIIDYVQLIMPSRHSENVVQQFTEISHGLKSLGRELNVPVIALSQLNRAVDTREVKIPRLSDLRETGSWEQDADIVMFIYRPDKDKLTPSLDDKERNAAEIHVAKHRNGPLGLVKLYFDADKVSFREVDSVHIEEPITPTFSEEITVPPSFF